MVFQRFICGAMTSPEEFEICHDRPKPAAQKVLDNMGLALIYLSNNYSFEDDHNLAFLNEFVDEQYSACEAFLEIFWTIPGQPKKAERTALAPKREASFERIIEVIKDQKPKLEQEFANTPILNSLNDVLQNHEKLKKSRSGM